MKPADLELAIEALSMAASRKESMSRAERSGDSRAQHERRAIAMRSLQKRLMDVKQGKVRGDTVSASIERTLVNYFEADGCETRHEAGEWHAWIGGKTVPLSELAVAIALALPAPAPA